MKRLACPRLRETEVARDGELGEAGALGAGRHLATCPDCSARVAELERLAVLGRALNVAPDEARARRVRGRMLEEAATGQRLRSLAGALDRPVDDLRAWRVRGAVLRAAVAALGGHPTRRWRWAAAAGAFAAAFAAAITLRPAAPPAVEPAPAAAAMLGAVTGSPGARFTQRGEGPVERVAVRGGRVQVRVARVPPGRRFLVDLPDGELEVRGTAFEIEVDEGRTREVAVGEGRVALRIGGGPEVLLAAGERWLAPAAVPPEVVAPGPAPLAVARRPRSSAAKAAEPGPPAPAPAPAPVGAAEPPPEATAAEPSPDLSAYRSAMDLYRKGEFAGAARAFAAFAAETRDRGAGEDAEFLEAVSLARAGRPDAAALVAERFLERHPTSFHRKDAAVLAARGARDRGDCGAARRILEPWADDAGEVAALRADCGR